MKKISASIASTLIRDKRPLDTPEVRAKYGILEGWVSIIGNILLFIIKITAGIKVQSTALIADAIHTLADSATSAVVIIGFKASQKPSDKEHPFGHGRLEPVATLIISVLLFVAGFELLKQSVYCILNPKPTHAGVPIIILISGTIVVKELMARFSFHLGDLIDSNALKADALHHRSDVYATALVVVALVASKYGFYMADGVMGCMVSVIIFISAFAIAKDAIGPLLGEPPSRKFIEQIEQLCKAKPGVIGVHDIVSHQYGQTNITSLHIEVSHKETALKLHWIAEDIEEEIAKKTNGMVVVHIDPVNREHPGYNDISETIGQIVDNYEKTNSFHDLRIVGEYPERCTAIFDIVTSDETMESENHEIIRYMKDKIAQTFPAMKIVIKATPKYSFKP